MTMVVSIGNSDNKLTQAEWATFIADVKHLVLSYGMEVHFVGYTAPDEKWQSATFVFEPYEGDADLFKTRLGEVLRDYRQDSAAIIEGRTQFLPAHPVTSLPD